MLNWENNADLTAANSFGFPVRAERFLKVDNIDDLESALTEVKENSWPLLILGGGSNLVLAEEIPGAVISVGFSGINILADEGLQVIVEAGAGENWHQFVGHLLEKGLHGLENLALIPGSVGAAPVQNIGAYGVEVAERLHSVIAYDRITGEVVQLNKPDCKFRYRNSTFKTEEKGRYIILKVRFTLDTEFTPVLTYKVLEECLAAKGVDKPDALQVYCEVCAIRNSKLPTPDQLGNAGSFFENPVVSADKYTELKQAFPQLVAYPEGDSCFKLAAGWLIDQAGWKGYRDGPVGVYPKQALVLVHYGQGSSEQLLALAEKIKISVYEKFAVHLEMEPRIYP